MRHLPIIVKFLTILGMFGVFAIASTVYSTGQMQRIAAANRALEGMRADIEELLITGNAAGDQAALAQLSADRARFEGACARPARCCPTMPKLPR